MGARLACTLARTLSRAHALSMPHAVATRGRWVEGERERGREGEKERRRKGERERWRE